MPTLKLCISPAAKNDLKDIYEYEVRQWGQGQSDSYLTMIKETFWSITEQPLMGIERNELSPSFRSFSIESHTVFYRIRNEKVEIIRVLHGRQDPQKHLK